MVSRLKNQRGQTSVEYLLLLAVAFITAFIMITGPVSDYVVSLLENISNNVQNLVKVAEWSGESIEIGSSKHPTSPEHFRALHFE